MEKITMLGTGHAMTLNCFNTCFVYENDNGKMLVDTGGGQQLLRQLRDAGISTSEIDAIFITHQHTDHLLGLPWIIRSAGHGRNNKPVSVYMHKELMDIALGMLELLLPEKLENFRSHVNFVSLEDGDTAEILGCPFTFFDTHNFKCSQFGFSMQLQSGKRLAFCGDVPFSEENRALIEGTDYLVHEAFSLESAKGPGGMPPMGGPMPPMGEPGPGMPGGPGKGPGGPGGPGNIGHSTVRGAAKIAEGLHAGTLILVHGSDDDLENRQKAYTEEAASEFSGRIFVPYDLDVIELD